MRATDSSSFIPAASIENPAASALAANEPAVAKTTLSPASTKARASGTSGRKCPMPAVQLNMTRVTGSVSSWRPGGSRLRATGHGDAGYLHRRSSPLRADHVVADRDDGVDE